VKAHENLVKKKKEEVTLMSEKHGEAVAVISRLDYGRPGFRRWILDALKTIATGIDEAKFVIIQGGLVSSKHLLAKLPKGAGKKLTVILCDTSQF